MDCFYDYLEVNKWLVNRYLTNPLVLIEDVVPIPEPDSWSEIEANQADEFLKTKSFPSEKCNQALAAAIACFREEATNSGSSNSSSLSLGDFSKNTSSSETKTQGLSVCQMDLRKIFGTNSAILSATLSRTYYD